MNRDAYRQRDVHEVEEWERGLVLGDEWANSLTHGFGLLLSIIGIFFLLIPALESSNPRKLLSFAVFGSSLILLYLASTLYHTFEQPKLKKAFRIVDHCAIYLLIAGSYTPFTMMPLEGFWGWLLFGVIWSLAAIGIVCKIFFIHRFKVLSTVIYIAMGWFVLIALEPLVNNFPYEGLIWLMSGGFFYTLGVLFFVLDKKRFFHAIWHLFVLGGSICHYFAILLYM